MSSRGVSAIVLAGGRSSRFGRDKLAEPIDGLPLLLHAIDAVRPVASEVLVVIAPGAQPPPAAGLIVVHDAQPFEGPLAGVHCGLGAAGEPVALIVGGDMPHLDRAVLELLIDIVAETGVEAVVLEHDGRGRPLPMAVRREPALAAAARLVAAGERRLGALVDLLAARTIGEPAWRALDPDARTINDVDTPADLP